MKKPKQTGLKTPVSKKPYYFNDETEKAIFEYRNETDHVKRSMIYSKYLDKPFNKLAENIINMYRKKLTYVSEPYASLKNHVVCHLVMNIDKIDNQVGRAFSYYTIAAINYLILLNRKNENKTRKETKLQYHDNEEDEAVDVDFVDPSDIETERNEDTSEFIDAFIKYMDHNIGNIVGKKKKYYAVLNAIIQILSSRNELDMISKKSVFFYIREMTNDTPQNISRILNVFKSIYEELHNVWIETGELDINYKIKNTVIK